MANREIELLKAVDEIKYLNGDGKLFSEKVYRNFYLLRDIYEELVKIAPRKLEYYMKLAEVYRNIADTSKAIDVLRAGVQLTDTKNVYVYTELAEDLFIQKRYMEALSVYKEYRGKNNIQFIKEKSTELEERIKKREEKLHRELKWSEDWYDRDKWSKAVSIYVELVKINPRKLDYYMKLAEAYKRNTSLLNAIDVLRKVIQEFPTYKDSYIYLADYLKQEKEYKEALILYKKCLVLGFEKKVIQSIKNKITRLTKKIK